MENNTKKRKLKISAILTIIAIILMIIGAICILLGIPKETKITTAFYNYQIKRNTGYTVLLRQDTNYFYDDLVRPSDKIYPSNSVDKLNINMIYMYEGSSPADITYTYDINASIIGEYKSDTTDEQIWDKKYLIQEQRTNKLVNTKSFAINDLVNLDYYTYNSIVSAYRQAFNLPISSYLSLKLTINYTVDVLDTDKDNIKKTDYVEVRIPLTETITKVEKKYQNSEKGQLTDITKIDLDYVMIGIGIGLFFAAFVVLIIANNKKVVTKHSLYKKNIDKVLKDYGDLIVTVKNKPNVKNLRVMALATIDDLVDVAEQNNCSIIRYEIPKKSESFLLVISSGYVYVYIVSDEDVEYSK